MSAAAAPLLAANGLAFSCLPTIEEGRITLQALLLHDSGERLSGSLPIAGGTPQQVGSALTYARRYLLGCMTGIVTDDDDDGQAAQQASSEEDRSAEGHHGAPRPTPAGRAADG